MSKEALLESKVVSHCKRNGILCYKFCSPSNRGVPDRVLVKAGRVLFLELKALSNRPSALQFRTLEKLREQGVVATWCDNYETAVQIIDDHFLP